MQITQESTRLNEAKEGKAAWRQWGPYLSERQYGLMDSELVLRAGKQAAFIRDSDPNGQRVVSHRHQEVLK